MQSRRMLNASTLVLIIVVPAALCQNSGDLFQISVKGQPNFCLDLYGGKTDAGTPIDIWTCAGVKGQQWYFDPGTFKIRSALAPTKCIDAGDMKQGTSLVLQECNINQQQFWSFADKTSTIYLYATTASSTMCMDVKDAVYKDGSGVQVWPCDGLGNQGWTIGAPPQPFKINVANQNLCLDLFGEKTDKDSVIDIWSCSGGKGQEWYWNSGSFKIQSAVDQSKCIDAGPNPGMRSQLMLWDCNGQKQQQFGYDDKTGEIFLGTDDKNQSLCMCLTDFKNGAPLQLFNCNTCTGKWTLTPLAPGATQSNEVQI